MTWHVTHDERPGRTRFGLLGPLLVEDPAGQVIAVQAAKQRIVLAALLLSPNAAVSLERLAEVLWDTRPPQNARAVARTYVMRLRQALGQASTHGSSAVRPGISCSWMTPPSST